MSNSIRIFTGERYCVDSYGNGWAYAITRLEDGASVWLQDSDAVHFAEEMERTNERFTYEDLCFIVFNYQ
ncbi:hypothetical protein IRY61_05375 [Candidatus Saccharibacteria bacterium]|nr:hypothetical protein [Candidatus Saccharibacteria bacterium]